jgi:hypothetical protein
LGEGTYDAFEITNGGTRAAADGYLTYRCKTMGACTITGNGNNGTNSVHFSYAGLQVGADRAANSYVIFDGINLLSNGGTFYPVGFNHYNGDNSAKIAGHHIWFLNGIADGFGQSGISVCCSEYHYIMHSIVKNNSKTQCDAQGSGIAVNTEHALPSYTPTADDKKPSPVFGFPTWEIGDGTFFHVVVAFNVAINNAMTKCGTASNKYNTDGNGIIFDTNDMDNTVPYHAPMLAYGNISTNSGAGGIHTFRSCNVWDVNNSLYNGQLDPYNSASARGTLSENLGGTPSCKNRMYNNISVAIAAAPPSGGCNYNSGSPLQWNSAALIGPQSGGTPYENNMTKMSPPNKGCNGEVAAFNGTVVDPAKNFLNTDPKWINVGKQSAGSMTTPPSGENFALAPDSPARGRGQVQPWMPATATDLGACPGSLSVCP